MAVVQDNDSYFCGHNEEEDTADWFLLKSYVVGIFIVNIIANMLVMWRIYTSKKLSRANMMFILLTGSDFFVALISIPLFSVTLFHLDDTPIYIHNCNLNLFIMYFPSYTSWYLTTAIAIDRLFVIKYHKKYKNFVSNKILLRVIISFLAFYIGVMFVCYFLRHRITTAVAASIFQMILTFIILFSYAYIFRFTQRKINLMQRHTNMTNQTASRLTRTIFHIFLCQVIFTLPAPIVNFVYVKHLGDDLLERKIRYWGRALFFSNSFINALILLQNQHKIKREERPDLYVVEIETNSSSP